MDSFRLLLDGVAGVWELALAADAFRFGPGEAATWKLAVADEASAFAAALRAVDAMDPETAQLTLHQGESHFHCLPNSRDQQSINPQELN